LAAGCLLCIAVIPGTVAIVNATWLRANPRWEFLRPIHIQLAVDWWNMATGMHVRLAQQDGAMPERSPFLQTDPPRVAATAKETNTAARSSPFPSCHLPFPIPSERASSSWVLTLKLAERLIKGSTWIGSLLLLTGLVCGWRIFLRPEHLTMLCMNLLLLAIARIRYWAAGLDMRYFMPLVIVGTPWMALGLEHILAAARGVAKRYGATSPRALRLVSGGLCAIAVACSLADSPMPATAHMRKHAALGRWIYDRAGPEPAIVGNLDYLSLDTFYANGRVVDIVLPGDRLTNSMPAALAQHKADVVVLWNEGCLPPECLADLQRQITQHCRYRRVDASALPAGENELMVLVKAD
jgi:hypothetical protein